MAKQVNIHFAKTHLSKLLDEVEGGDDVIIARAGKPVARVTALEKGNARLQAMGMDRGKVMIADDFDAPLPDDILRDFEE